MPEEKRPLFPLGRVVATPAALKALEDTGDDSFPLLAQHVMGYWGELDDEDWQANDRAVEEGTRILSAYRTSSGVKLWIITEADRSATTLLLPEEY